MTKPQKEAVELFLSKNKLRQALFHYAFGLLLLMVMIVVTTNLWYSSSHRVASPRPIYLGYYKPKLCINKN